MGSARVKKRRAQASGGWGWVATHISDRCGAVRDGDMTIGIGTDSAITFSVPNSRAKHNNLEEDLETVHDSAPGRGHFPRRHAARRVHIKAPTL